jgi:hypothetical protein
MSDFEKSVDAHQEELNKGGYWKPKEGNNVIRILAEPAIEVSRFKDGVSMVCYKGAPYCSDEALKADVDKNGNPARLNKKWLTWVIDRVSGEIMLYSMPYAVVSQLLVLKRDIDAGTDFENFPMGYDVTLAVKNAGKKEVEYKLNAHRKEVPLTEEEVADFEKQTPVDQIVEKKKDKWRRNTEGDSAGMATPDPDYNAEEAGNGEF